MTARASHRTVCVSVVAGSLALAVFGAGSAQAADRSNPLRAASRSTAAAGAATARSTCPSDTLAAWKTIVGQRISVREAALTKISSRLDSAVHLSSSDRAGLTTVVATDSAGLTALASKVAAETACSAVRVDAAAVVQDYYVFALVVPQAGLTAGADAGLAGAGSLTAAEPAIRRAIALMPAGATKTAAQASYDDLVAQTATATSSFTGVGAAVLALTPPAFPTRTGVLKTQAARAATGAQALARAVKDAQALQADFT